MSSEGCALSEQARFVADLHRAELTWLAGRIKAVEARLRSLTADDAVVARLLSDKGIGPVTAWTMRAVIGRFDRFTTGKQLARFCALTPRNASSGQRLADAGLIKAGDRLLKSVLVEAAQRLRRYQPRWRALSDSLEARGKPRSVVVAAVANRWVRGLYHQMKEVGVAA
jgi:transposase